MRIIDVVHQVLPVGTDAAFFGEVFSLDSRQEPTLSAIEWSSHLLCPIWPPDLFAVVGTIIDRSGCYTEASPNRDDLPSHEAYLKNITSIARSWKNLLKVPRKLQALWEELIVEHGEHELGAITANQRTLQVLLMLFAIADDVSKGMGWDKGSKAEKLSDFATIVLANADPEHQEVEFPLPYWPRSLCAIVSPDRVIVLPKSITTTKGCTIRSLSHNLALLPCETVLMPQWRLVSQTGYAKKNAPIQLLLVPFPYTIPDESFTLSSGREWLYNRTSHAAFFGLEQRWLNLNGQEPLHGGVLAHELIIPMINEARELSGSFPTGVVLPECALSADATIEMVRALQGSGIEFVITGALEHGEDLDRPFNMAYTIAMLEDQILAQGQSKHHRWRIDQGQANQYGLDFDPDKTNHQWWEDIDVSMRDLPFYALRQDMSMVTLICEDLARMDPAMNAIRAVGPNLVVALLMDGPQLSRRWPGRYAGVLADEPGCAVLTLTCAGTVNLSNRHHMISQGSEEMPDPIVAFWKQADGREEHIELPYGANGVLLRLQSRSKHQTTLDNRSDRSSSRELNFKSQTPLFRGHRP